MGANSRLGAYSNKYGVSQTEINFWFSQSAKQCQNPCSGPPPVYQDLSTCHDWPVNKAIVNLPIRLKGNSKCISSSVSWVNWGPRTRISALLCRRYRVILCLWHRLGSKAWGNKQKSTWGSGMNNTILLFYYPQASEPWINFNISKFVYCTSHYYPWYQRFFSRAAGIFGVGWRPTHLRP